MSLWNHLPLKLLGARFEANVGCSIWRETVYWYRFDSKTGNHYREVMSSTEWAWEGVCPMASVMRRHWSWWVLTGRDEDDRAGRIVAPWKMGDSWHSIGGTDNFVAPWPWVPSWRLTEDPWPWPKASEARDLSL